SAFLFSVQVYAQGMVEIGTGTSSQNKIPAYFYYDYSWGTAIYLDSEIGLDEPFLFTKISYHVASCSGSPYYAMDQKIWMRHTDLDQFSDYYYPDPYNDPSWTLVKGEFEVWWIAQSWVDFQLDSPFVYDGVSNIEILWENWDGSYASGYPRFYYTNKSNRCKYKYADGSFPTGSGSRSYYVANLRIYYEPLVPGTIEGTVSDAVTGLPVIGAKVTAGSNYGVSLADGTYSFEALPFTFDVTCEKAGYATATAYDITVPGGGTVTVDFALTEDAVPPSGVHAELREIDLEVVDITWGVPYGLYEIIYDDGEFENMTAWLEAGSLNALRFTPIAYPCAIEGGSVHIGDGTYPAGGDPLQPFSIAVYAGDGAN
ncbi:MAG: carboxypeptidase regulatory-like domain-containing protein, partial [Bacteroidales bacterium]|nr:carboxypeptidase regulatory-like domain-containing protein [Bacteroidales bacterium]